MAKRATVAPEAPVTEPAPPPQDMAERVGQRVGNFTSRTLRGVFRAIGRVREEAEDVWAEAQALRHREAAASSEVKGS